MYLGFYGLRQEPFRLAPDPRFLHLAEPHRNALRSMLEGVGARKGMQVATGPVGTGKTTLLYCLQHILSHEASPQHPLRSAFVVNPTLTPGEFYEVLLDELELPKQGSKPACLRELHRLLLKASRENGNVVVIVDEAHLISPAMLEEIRLLANLDNYPKSVLQIILCGQPELMVQLRSPELSALRQRVAIYSHLRVLTLAECRSYVAERLHVAGHSGESPFMAAAIEEIHKFSGGVPRVINLLCDRTLTIGFRQEMKRVGTDCVVEGADELGLTPARMDGINGKAVDFAAATRV